MSVGDSLPRIDGIDKLGGRTRYVDDIAMPGMLHAGTVRAPVARGVVKKIRFDPGVNWDKFVIADHKDLPGENVVATIQNDMPALVDREIRYKHEPVLLLAHRSIRKLREALAAVRVEVEALPAVADPLAPLAPEQVQHGDDNVFKRIDIRKGDPAAVFRDAPHVVEGLYYTGAQEHLYIEPNGVISYFEAGRLVVAGSMQCPYYMLDALTRAFGRTRESFRVIQLPTGGGFGGKEEFPSILAIHAALLAEKSGAPVKLVYDRVEDMAASTKRHPGVVKHRTALDRDGKLLAMEIDVVLDGGAYVTLSPVVLSRGALHACGAYSCDNVHVHAEARLTNSPPYGAFRGFGAPQTIFALERHMDVAAGKLGLKPEELRRCNLLKPGDTMATGQVYREKTDLAALLDRALTYAGYETKRREHEVFNSTHPYLRRGVGMASFMHGAGFTGGGEVYLASEVEVEAAADGSINVLTAQCDMGQGCDTTLAQVAADRLGVAVDAVKAVRPDTSIVPNSGPTVASRTIMVVGKLVSRACGDLLRQVAGRDDISGEKAIAAIRAWHDGNPGGRLIGRAKYAKPVELDWDEDAYQGDAYATYGWASYVAEIEVDLRTYVVRAVDFVALQEVGKTVNPAIAAGQIQGGVAQGIGWALYESVALEDGAMSNTQMTNYVIPCCGDLPPIRVYFEEQPSQYGPRGAKGIGELPMDGPAPAIVNAVCQALKINVNETPLTPERLMEHLEFADHG